MSNELANLFASRFIARKDVKAVQFSDGSWAPETVSGKHDGERIPWNRAALLNHLDGKKTYGHYMLNTDDRCKLFAFDIDLEKAGLLPLDPFASAPEDNFADWKASFMECNPRDEWRNRASAGRNWMKIQFRTIAHRFVAAIEQELAIPVAAAYSGNKGIHVYGFTGPVPAAEAREGAMIVLDSLGDWEPSRGVNFFRCKNTDPVDGFPNLSIEVFPKQGSLDGKDLGNLMRLPLGRNLKTTDPTFFIDMTSSMAELKPVDPVHALTKSPWVPA